MTASGDHLGPALTAVRLDDAEGLRALFAEQRARLEVVRDNEIWQWFGGVPSGFGRPAAVLHGVYLQIAFVSLFALALVVAGFTRGPVLWGVAGLAASCLLVRALLLGPPTRETLSFYRRAVQVPGVIVALAPATAGDEQRSAAVLVAFGVNDAAALEGLVAAGDRLRRLVEGMETTPAALASLVAAILRRRTARDHDGSRTAVTAEVGPGTFELAHLRISPNFLPGEEVTSRLLFVLADPERRTAGHARVVQSSLWGEAAAGLCAALPLEVAP